MDGHPELSVILPAHNEAENLRHGIPLLAHALREVSVELIVVNNASTDETLVVLAELAALYPVVAVSEPTLGYGRAVRAGLAHARGAFVAIIRADGQERPEDLIALYTKSVHGEGELMSGVRRGRARDGVVRLITSAVYNRLFRLMFRIPYRDINGAPKVITRALYERLNLESVDWFLDAEIILKAHALGCTIGQLDVECLPRSRGRSTVRLTHVHEFIRNMLHWRKRYRNGELVS